MPIRPEETPEETSLPTPAATPTPYPSSETESESGSASSNTTVHTATPFPTESLQPRIMSSSADDFRTPAQLQAAHITNVLHKTPIKPPLSATNYVAWSDSVRFGLSAASYDIFLETDEIDDTGLDHVRHVATKKCIFHWLLANMETSQSTRFISMISTFENGIKNTPFSPALL